MAQRRYDLPDAELEVLSALWEQGTATVREVLNLLHDKGRKLAYTTVLTFMTRLEQKGFVVSDRSGVAYVYKPTVSRHRVQRSRIKELVSQLYDGATGPLVLQLVRQKKLSQDELAELHQLIDELDSTPR